MEKFLSQCVYYASNLFLSKSFKIIEEDFNEDIELSEIKEYVITYDGDKILGVIDTIIENKSTYFNDLIKCYIRYYDELIKVEELKTLNDLHDLINDIIELKKINNDFGYYKLLLCVFNNGSKKNKYIDLLIKYHYKYTKEPTQPNLMAMKKHYEKYGNIYLNDLMNCYLYLNQKK